MMNGNGDIEDEDERQPVEDIMDAMNESVPRAAPDLDAEAFSDPPPEEKTVEMELPSGRIIDPNDPDEVDQEVSEADFPDLPKIQVLDSDGVFRGGLWDQRQSPKDRRWLAPPAKDYGEMLYASASGMFLRVFRSKDPQLTGSAECTDLFDADSYAVRCTAAEAAEWLRQHGYAVPDDIDRAAGGKSNSTVALERFLHAIRWTSQQSSIIRYLWERESAGFDALIAAPGCFRDGVADDEAVIKALRRFRKKLNEHLELGASLSVFSSPRRYVTFKRPTDKTDK